MREMLSVVLNLYKRRLRRRSGTEHTLIPLLLHEQETVMMDEGHLTNSRILDFSSSSFGLDHARKHLIDVNLLALIFRQPAPVHVI